MYPVVSCWEKCLKNHNLITMYPLDKCNFAPNDSPVCMKEDKKQTTLAQNIPATFVSFLLHYLITLLCLAILLLLPLLFWPLELRAIPRALASHIFLRESNAPSIVSTTDLSRLLRSDPTGSKRTEKGEETSPTGSYQLPTPERTSEIRETRRGDEDGRSRVGNQVFRGTSEEYERDQ